MREPAAQRHERPGDPVGHAAREQRQSEQRQQHPRHEPPVLVGVHRPRATHGRKAGHQRERHAHADEHRQAIALERAIGAENTNGSTGRMQELTMVSTPPM